MTLKNRKILLPALVSIALVFSLILPPVVAEASGTALQGTWVLEYYGDSGNLIAPYPDTDITLTISGSDFSGHAGINSYYGKWKVVGDKLLIIEGYSTEAAGPEHLMEQEDRYFRTLFVPEVTYEITNGKLTLSSSEGLLVFMSEAADRGHGECDVGGWTNITQVAAGSWHTVGLKSDGTVVAVGNNYDGQCEVGDWTDITQVAGGFQHTVGLKSDGTVVAVGDNYDGQCDVSGWTGINQTAAGSEHTVGLKFDGTVVSVGNNDFGQCDVGGWTDNIQVAAGHAHTVGLKSNGTVVAAGGWDAPCHLPTPGCFIATAAYGTPMAGEIEILREFRDEYLLTNPLGQALVDLYYRVSPPMAEFITEHPSLKPIVRAGLLPAVAMSVVAVNTTPAEKAAILGLLALVSVALAVWATR